MDRDHATVNSHSIKGAALGIARAFCCTALMLGSAPQVDAQEVQFPEGAGYYATSLVATLSGTTLSNGEGGGPVDPEESCTTTALAYQEDDFLGEICKVELQGNGDAETAGIALGNTLSAYSQALAYSDSYEAFGSAIASASSDSPRTTKAPNQKRPQPSD